MKEWITDHADWCQSKDNSQVFWDQEDGVTLCRECLAVAEERDSDVEGQMLEEPDGHPT